jgi:hypothetical protein
MLSAYLNSRGPGAPLRVGVLLDDTQLPRCFAEVLEHIARCNFARLELLVLNAESQPHAAARRSWAQKIWRLLRDPASRASLLFALYQRYDRRNEGPTDPNALVDCAAQLANVECLRVVPLRQRFVHRFPAEALEQIRAKKLDVLLRFGFNILRGGILQAARYGVWSYHHGDDEEYRGGPACFWELYEGNPLTGTMLQVLTEELDAGLVLQKGLFATVAGISRAQNSLQPYWGSVTYVIQKLHELHERGWEHVRRQALPQSAYRGRKKIYTAPSNWEMVKWLAPVIWRKSATRLLRRPTLEHWRLALRRGRDLLAETAADSSTTGFRLLDSPPGRFYADPFVFEHEGTGWLFFEDCDYATNRGRISCAELRDGTLGSVQAALERPYHLSYPCIFRASGEIFMIPESVANGTVELYRCTGFPDQWQLERELLRERAVDTTVWIDQDLCWFFVTLQEARGGATQLWLFYARNILDPWQAHPANPISTDVRNSRGAGAVFRHAGRLYRPSQDCSRHYGYSFTLNEILVCNPEQYLEKPCVTLRPDWAPGLLGTHTYSRAAQVEVIDGCGRLPVGRVL